MTKLKNITALNKMLTGEHQTQTKTVIGFSDAESQGQKQKNREFGEIWEEKDASGKTICWWELTPNGTKIKYNMHPDVVKQMHAAREYLKSFPNCQKEICTCTKPTSIDYKFRKLTGMCEDCTITMETRMKIRGEFDAYANEKLRQNAQSFLREADREVEVLKNSLKNLDFVDEFGIETWSADNIDYYLDQIDRQYAEFKAGLSEKVSLVETPENAPQSTISDGSMESTQN